MKEHILVGITSIRSEVNTGLLGFCANLTNAEDRRFTLHVVNGARPVDYARNTVAQEFLANSDYDRLWFLDHDGVPPPNALDLLEVDADIVSGIVPVWMGPNKERKCGAIVFNVYDFVGEEKKYSPISPPVEPTTQKMDGAGCACMIIRRKVLEDGRMRYGRDYKDMLGTPRTLGPEEPPSIFRTHHKPNGEVLLSEDLDFCHRATSLGYTARYYTGTQFGHLKFVNLMDMMKVTQVIYSKGIEQGLREAKQNGNLRREAAV